MRHAVSNSENYKKRVLKARDIDTITTGKRLGHPVRSLKNSFSRKFFELEYSDLPNEELEKFGAGALRKAAREGDEVNGCFMAGQCAALVKDELPAAQIISRMFEQAEECLKGAQQWLK